MANPRCILPGVTYHLTRRCSERRFFLRPAFKVNRILLYCLALAAHRFGILLHAFCFLSDHYHLVATDPHGQLPLFMHCFNLLVARALNSHFGRFEAFWAPGSYCAVCLTDSDSILDKIAYTLANPVAAGLVCTANLWPGLHSRPRDIGASPRSVPRPPRFFRHDSKHSLPAMIPLSLSPPPGFEDLPLDTVQTLIAERVASHENQARLARDGRPFLGRRRVRKQSIHDRAASHEPRFGINPRVAGRDKWKRIEALQHLRSFLTAYRRALDGLRAGIREFLFPAGTWRLQRELGVPCEAPS
jgi:putative transposase